jgi:hypothetical protein
MKTLNTKPRIDRLAGRPAKGMAIGFTWDNGDVVFGDTLAKMEKRMSRSPRRKKKKDTVK